jgi:hypothetical protein
MKTFYRVTLFCFVVGMLIVCFHAPWTSGPEGSLGVHSSLGFAPVWSAQFASVPGAHVSASAIAILAAVVAFFSIVIGGSAYFFRTNRSGEKDLME